MTEHCGENMNEYSNTEGCHCGKKMHSHECKEGCHCSEKFLELADSAWKEALKDKIKAKIIAKKEDHIDKLAELIATANGERWKNKIAAKTKCNEFKDNLKEFFSSCD